MLELLPLLVAIGASARLTRLVTTDALTAPMRDPMLYRVLRPRPERKAIENGDEVDPPTPTREWFYTLLTCRWCAGFWITALVVTTAYHYSGHLAYDAISTTLAASYVLGWLADNEAGE